MRAILALEDGRFFEGESFGATGTRVGEICFNTSMTGYQEVLTDPSYHGQIVAMTYPLIGNYGINSLDQESRSPHVRGFVIEELSKISSNWRSEMSLDEYLRQWDIPGVQGIDTRALTRHLRTRGAMKACLTTENMSPEEAAQRAIKGEGVIGIRVNGLGVSGDSRLQPLFIPTPRSQVRRSEAPVRIGGAQVRIERCRVARATHSDLRSDITQQRDAKGAGHRIGNIGLQLQHVPEITVISL